MCESTLNSTAPQWQLPLRVLELLAGAGSIEGVGHAWACFLLVGQRVVLLNGKREIWGAVVVFILLTIEDSLTPPIDHVSRGRNSVCLNPVARPISPLVSC